METKNTVILYHGNCLDGFGAAYAAWKKFEDSATYIAVFHGDTHPQGLAGKEVYIADFSYPKEQLLELERQTKRLVVLDHHEGAREYVELVREYVFDNNRSGSGITWEYFNAGTPLPRLLAYIQDGDLWRHSLPNWREVGAYLSTVPFTFETFDTLATTFADDTQFEKIIQKGAAFAQYRDYLCEKFIESAQEVQFDEFSVLAVNAPRLFNSQVGNLLAQKHPPFAIVWYPHGDQWHFSLRGTGEVDLAAVAQRRGGNGHHNAASFRVPFGQPLPFSFKK